MNRRVPEILVTVVVSVVLAACGGPTPTPSPTPKHTLPASPRATPTGSPTPIVEPTPPPTTTPGGTLTFGEWQPVSQLNPFFSTAFTTIESLGPALRGLLTTDENGQWVADLAADVPSIANGGLVINPDAPADCTTDAAPTGVCFTVRLTMKPGYGWSDGKPVTMNDALATYNWAAAVGAAGIGCAECASAVPLFDASIEDPAAKFKPKNRYIKDFTVSADGMTATITWQKNYAGWLGWASLTLFQADWLATLPVDENTPNAMNIEFGTRSVASVPWNGPFKIVSASTEGIDYDPNPGWGGSPPYLDHLRERFYTAGGATAGKDDMIADFLAGKLDLVLDMTQADFPIASTVDPSVGRAEADPAWQYEHLALNAAHGPLTDPAVRNAIAMAIDKQGLVDALFPGIGIQPACSVGPPGSWWYDPTVACASYDATAAAAALDAAGWRLNPDSGLREKDLNGDGSIEPWFPADYAKTNTEQLYLHLCTAARNSTRLAELARVKADLAAIGIKSDIKTRDHVFGWGGPAIEQPEPCDAYAGWYDVADSAYVLGGDLYVNYFYTYHSSQIPEVNSNGSNVTRLSDPAMDAALEAMRFEIDPVRQVELASTVQHIVATQNNEVPLYYRAETTGVGIHLGGWNGYNPSSAGPTWHVEDWYYIP